MARTATARIEWRPTATGRHACVSTDPETALCPSGPALPEKPPPCGDQGWLVPECGACHEAAIQWQHRQLPVFSVR